MKYAYTFDVQFEDHKQNPIWTVDSSKQYFNLSVTRFLIINFWWTVTTRLIIVQWNLQGVFINWTQIEALCFYWFVSSFQMPPTVQKGSIEKSYELQNIADIVIHFVCEHNYIDENVKTIIGFLSEFGGVRPISEFWLVFLIGTISRKCFWCVQEIKMLTNLNCLRKLPRYLWIHQFSFNVVSRISPKMKNAVFKN